MTNLREAAQMALDALEHLQTDIEWQYKSPTRAMLRKVEKALRAVLAQPEQEPVACPYCHYSHTLGAVFFDQNCAGCVKRMTAPPQRECCCGDSSELNVVHRADAPCFHYEKHEWQGLTDEGIEDACWTEVDRELRSFARAIETKLREKNA